jgi:hypothetical protein
VGVVNTAATPDPVYISRADVHRILAEARAKWHHGSRIDHGDAMLDYLDVQFIPLAEGEPVQFQTWSSALWRPATFTRMITEPDQDGSTTPRFLVTRPSGKQVEVYPLMIRRPRED